MKKKIAVIGGGIAGLTFARQISTREFDIHIFEKKPDFEEIGAAISVFPNALAVMDELGLLNDILSKSGQFENVFLKTDKGNILSKTSPKSDYPVVCIHRKDLHDILLKNIKAELHSGYEILHLSNLENDQVKLEFKNGKTFLADAVVGADGIHSVVRKHVINDGEPTFRGYNIWRGIVESDFEIGYASETYGSGKRVGIVPVKDGVYGWWATYNEGFLKDDEPEGTKVKLNRLFGNWHHPIPELINNTEQILKNSLVDRNPQKGWTKKNISLIGDAAHPTTPNLGQGGCTAIEGAYLLAKCLNKYGISYRAFTTYEENHFHRTKEINKESLKLGKLGQISNPLLISIRNFFFRITPSSLAMKMISKYFSYRVTEIKI